MESDKVTESGKVILVRTEGEEAVPIDEEAAKISEFITKELAKNEDKADLKNTVKVGADITIGTLEKVADFCHEYFKHPMEQIPKPLLSNDLSHVVSKFYVDFQNVEIKELESLYTAAVKLEIQPLIELISASIATTLMGKSIKEIRDEYEIPDDLDNEEKEEANKEGKWPDEAI